MKNLLLKIVTFTIVIGIVGFAINTLFGSQTILYLQKKTFYVNGNSWYMWEFKWWDYIKNLQTTATDGSILQFDLPTRVWNNDILNNLAVLGNFLIMIVNFLLYPIKVGAYLIQNVLALLGVNNDVTNTRNGLAWLVEFVRNILGNIAIPYI